MKQITGIFSLFFVFTAVHLQAQLPDDAKILYDAKNYEEAAAMYYRLYLFNEAANAYQMQIELLIKDKKNVEAEALKPLMLQAEKAARMVSRCEDIQIIDSLITDKNFFLTAYLMGEESGKLEKAGNTVIHENQLGDRRFFGKEDENSRLRLHTQLNISKNWSEDKILDLPTDTLGDDNFPFVMPDGLTVYYASTGSESIGGYDIFISRYNMNNDTYLSPNQMGMPFNSIYNDYMLAIDEVNGIGYFATDRFQPEGKVIVYTFIPNDEFKPVENRDEQALIERAKISAIRDTWTQNVNYQSFLDKFRNNIEKERQKTKKDFTFVINDNIVYYTMNDFDSDAAKNSFLKATTLQEKIRDMESSLDSQRQEYARGNAAKKQSLKSSILANEKQLEDLYGICKQAKVEARNLEINFLRQKQQ
ncbi:MAG: tetratricopeptide repeat protein [Dysgonamonadaceae bacterium]|jgi:hypothetical protein|nr:tetratricopeptide repeat protein [Dysgonamonadaceae bacterium]